MNLKNIQKIFGKEIKLLLLIDGNIIIYLIDNIIKDY